MILCPWSPFFLWSSNNHLRSSTGGYRTRTERKFQSRKPHLPPPYSPPQQPSGKSGWALHATASNSQPAPVQSRTLTHHIRYRICRAARPLPPSPKNCPPRPMFLCVKNIRIPRRAPLPRLPPQIPLAGWLHAPGEPATTTCIRCRSTTGTLASRDRESFTHARACVLCHDH